MIIHYKKEYFLKNCDPSHRYLFFQNAFCYAIAVFLRSKNQRHLKMSRPWHDINAPDLRQKPKQPESNKPAVTDDAPPPAPQKPLVKLSDGKFVPPDEGAAINKKCPVQVSVEYLDDSAKSMKKVTFSLYSNYNGQTSNLSHYADGYEKDGIVQAELILYPPSGYQDGDNVDYFFKAEHIRGEKIIDSEDKRYRKKRRRLSFKRAIMTKMAQQPTINRNPAIILNPIMSLKNCKAI